MQRSVISTVLIVLLSLSVLGTAVLSCWYVQSIRVRNRLHGQALEANRNRLVFQSLINDANEYGKSNNTNIFAILSELAARQALASATNSPDSSVR